jgi:hypothetical protein
MRRPISSNPLGQVCSLWFRRNTASQSLRAVRSSRVRYFAQARPQLGATVSAKASVGSGIIGGNLSVFTFDLVERARRFVYEVTHRRAASA